jgi:sister-chromatid-cohesion protein PDS5
MVNWTAGLNDRLLDHDDKVRIAAVQALCDLVNANAKWVPIDKIKAVAERLRDKKVCASLFESCIFLGLL